jgi:hypothetical protein
VYLRATQYDHSDGLGLALERDCENGAKSRHSLTLGVGVFRVGLDIGNLNRLAGKQGPPDNCASPRHKCGSLGNFFKISGKTEIGDELHHTIARSIDPHQIGFT